MNSFKLNQTHLLILRLIRNKLGASQIAKKLKVSQSNVSQRLIVLEREGYIRRKLKGKINEIWLTVKGQGAIEGASATFSVSPSKTEKVHQNLNNQSVGSPGGSAPSSPTVHAKRANGFKLYAALFLTEYTKLEAKLADAGISYEQRQIKHSRQYSVQLDGYKLVFTTRKLIIYCDDALYNFKLDAKLIMNEELIKANRMLSNFIRITKIRLVEEYNKIWIRIAHYEIAHTNSGIAGEVTEERKGLIPLAFDPVTLKIVSWADRSLNLKEWEFSDYRLERKVAAWTQAIRDNKLDPLEDHFTIGRLADLAIKQDKIITMLMEQRQEDRETMMQSMNELTGRLEQPREKRWKGWTT